MGKGCMYVCLSMYGSISQVNETGGSLQWTLSVNFIFYVYQSIVIRTAHETQI